MKKRLISKMCALALAGTIATTGLVGCGDPVDTSDLTNSVKTEIKQDITNCSFVTIENSSNDYYFSIFTHYNNGVKTGIGPNRVEIITEYLEHKDYRVTYKVTKEDYDLIAKFESKKIKDLKQNEIEILKFIISYSEPIEIKNLEVSSTELHEDFVESFRFNEEEYLKNLEEENSSTVE